MTAKDYARRLRRPRNLILITVALAVIGLGIGGVAWVDSYQPIVRGTGVQWPQGSKPGIGEQAMNVTYRKGKPFAVGVSLVNTGRFTVHVTGMESWGDILPVRTRLYLAGPMPNDGGVPAGRRPFHPFDLAPGKEAFLELRGVYRGHCHAAPPDGATATGTGGFEVHYSFLWRTGTAAIALPEPLYVNPPKGQDCAVGT